MSEPAEIRDFEWSLCDGTLIVGSYLRDKSHPMVIITNRQADPWTGVTLSWEQWEDFQEAVRADVRVTVTPPPLRPVE